MPALSVELHPETALPLEGVDLESSSPSDLLKLVLTPGSEIPKPTAAPAAEEPANPDTPKPTGEPSEPAKADEKDAPASEPGDPNKEPPEGEEEDDDKPLSKRSMKKQFAALRGTIRDLKTQIAQQVKPAADLNPELPGNASPPPAKAVEPTTPKPKEADFDTYAEYLDATVDWKNDQRDTARAATEAKQKADADTAKAKAEAADVTAKWNALVLATAKDADYDDIVDVLNSNSLPITRVMEEAIMTSPVGPKVAYFLTEHLDECKRIAELSPVASIRELGKLEAKFAETPKTTSEPKKAGPALPKPPKNVGGKGAAAELDLADPNIPMSQFKALAAKSLTRTPRF